jgi:hypothetical protein
VDDFIANLCAEATIAISKNLTSRKNLDSLCRCMSSSREGGFDVSLSWCDCCALFFFSFSCINDINPLQQKCSSQIRWKGLGSQLHGVELLVKLPVAVARNAPHSIVDVIL